MAFETDKQTLDDLNILSRHGAHSISAIFNRCISRGGSGLLEDMFRHPLSDCEKINNRSHIIGYFAGAGLKFPVTGMQFDAIEPYLANTDERTKLSMNMGGLTSRIGKMLAPNVEVAALHKGITSLVAALRSLRRFMLLPVLEKAEAYAKEREQILEILEAPEFSALFEKGLKAKLSEEELASFDTLLRFRHRKPIMKLMRLVYRLDVYMTVARVAAEKAFVFSRALPAEQKNIRVEGMYHPAVPDAVSNDIHIQKEGNVVFLTGANMAGKSTLMKSLSITLFLAHMGFPVPATSMEFSVLNGIYTTINLPDNLGEGASHFYAEVLRLKKIARKLGEDKQLFIVFDELFRGTNVKDAHEATVAVIEAFATRKDSFFVISTHIIEAGDILKQACDNIRFLYLPTVMEGNHPVYTYKLQEGITEDRHGMVIVQNEKIIDILNEGKNRHTETDLTNHA